MSARFTFGIGILLAQVLMIAIARVHPMRYYCWAPFDSQNTYKISATANGRELSPNDIRRRYNIGADAVTPRAIYEVTSVVAYVESVYRPHDDARVQVTYRTNGGAEQVWRWPLQ